MTLTTPRLTLRRLTVDDAQAMYDNWATDEKVTKYLTWNVHPSVEATREFLAKCVSEYDSPECYHWVIEYGGTIVGTINFHDVKDRLERLEMGYCLGSKWWNRGVMTEAAGAAIRYAFEELNAHKVCALYDTENPGSGRVMQKNGMVLEGVLRGQTLRKDGTWGDLAYYGILKGEWIERRGSAQ